MTASRRKAARDNRMRYAEVAGLMRRGYVRPLPEPPSLHQMARRRQADNTNPPNTIKPEEN